MTFKHILAWAAALVLASATQAFAQIDTSVKTVKDAELLIPRPQLGSVPSLELDGTQALDTLDTSSPDVMIILYANNTWKYYRNPESIMSKELFSKDWSTESATPYSTSLESLPNKISLWIVDTLAEYKCPHQGSASSRFGYRHRRRHQGVDLPLHTGDPVYAAFAGKVRLSKYYSGYGNLVIVRHENGLETFYAHLSKRVVSVGEWVDAGQLIGLGGSTGRSTGPHLHFETRYQGYAFDPEWLIDFETGTLRHRLFVLKKKYLNAGSRYVPESDEEEEEINEGDAKDKATADSLAAVDAARKAAAAKAAASAQYYRIRKGDTLGKIARRYGTTVNKICSLNSGLTSRTTLKIGRRIRVK